MYIDIHTHDKSKEEDVLQIKNIFLNNDFENELKNEYFSIGLHPWHINSKSIDDILILNKAIYNKKIIAIGEIGLDKNIENTLDEQLPFLEKQLQYSENHKLPVILHIVKTYNEIISLRKNENYNQTWIIHGFNKKIDLANQLIKDGFYLSFGTSLINNSSSQKTFQEIDLSRVFLETDDDNIYSIKDVYKKAAEIRSISIENLEKIIEYNFIKVFKRYDG